MNSARLSVLLIVLLVYFPLASKSFKSPLPANTCLSLDSVLSEPLNQLFQSPTQFSRYNPLLKPKYGISCSLEVAGGLNVDLMNSSKPTPLYLFKFSSKYNLKNRPSCLPEDVEENSASQYEEV